MQPLFWELNDWNFFAKTHATSFAFGVIFLGKISNCLKAQGQVVGVVGS